MIKKIKVIIFIVLSLFPSFLHVKVRRILGQKIGKGSKIKMGTFIFSKKVEIGENTKIGPFSFIRANEFKIGDHSMIKPLVIINTREVNIDNYVHFAPLSIINSEFTKESFLYVGDHSRIFPFCWLDTGEGITIGKHVGIGGHTLMFTHGVWSNYVEGGPISYGPIEIKDNVWLPWRVFILPDVTIGENVIVGGNSLINKSIDANSFVGGIPAKVLKSIDFNTTDNEKNERFNKILNKFSCYIQFKNNLEYKIQNDKLVLDAFSILIDNVDAAKNGDLIILLSNNTKGISELINKEITVLDYSSLTIYMSGKNKKTIKDFVSFLRRYGIRLYVK